MKNLKKKDSTYFNDLLYVYNGPDRLRWRPGR